VQEAQPVLPRHGEQPEAEAAQIEEEPGAGAALGGLLLELRQREGKREEGRARGERPMWGMLGLVVRTGRPSWG